MYSYQDIYKFCCQKSPEGIIVDTEVLTLFLLGKYKPDLVETNKLTKGKFFKPDIIILDNILQFFKKIIITPYILAEVSNLSRINIKDPQLSKYFQSMIKFLENAGEKEIKFNDLCKTDVQLISKYGFTDVAMFHISDEMKIPIITIDLDFYIYSSSRIPIINFTHIKASEG